ncbi:DegT/DnrJ/EryC1/StrS aminotransferase family protein [Polynucleobacter paneuropaeus]|nr:DegT/DnrJ/EryC1/StrS aminotransferase family protein [Polynucleobacter paneuropaeus]
MKQKIPYTKPSITNLEIKYATDAVTNGWGDKCYEYIDRFEKLFKEHLGVEYAIATSSCTGALHLGMSALGIGAGDEVIMADTNWIATASSVVNLGAKPVFVDILPDSWCINPLMVEEAITPRTKAIIAVHLYGNLCEMNKLLDIGERYGIPVIEDAAEAIGALCYEKRAGSIGRFGAFSFHGTKTITTGEGGMFVTQDANLYESALTLSNHGRVRGQAKQFWPERVGFKFKMSNVQAAIGCAQVERIDELIGKKLEILDFYRRGLEGFDGLTMNPTSRDLKCGGWMPTVVFDKKLGITREMLQHEFQRESIDARVFFWPLSSLNMFNPCPQNINAWDIPTRAINLPSFHEMKDFDQELIINVIKKLI